MSRPRKKNTTILPPRKRRYFPTDDINFDAVAPAREENPDWLIGGE